MNTLIRTETAGFKISECHTLDEIKQLCEADRLEEILIPTENVFFGYSSVTLNEKQSSRIKNGVFVSAPGIEEGKKYRVYDNKNNFLCICQCTEGRLRIVKSFF